MAPEPHSQSHSQPLHTPAIAEGLFAIKREYSYEVSIYDESMDISSGCTSVAATSDSDIIRHQQKFSVPSLDVSLKYPQ